MHETRSGQRSEEQLGGAGGASGLLPLTRGSIVRENDKEKVHPSKHSKGQRSRKTTPTPVQSGPGLVSDQTVSSAKNKDTEVDTQAGSSLSSEGRTEQVGPLPRQQIYRTPKRVSQVTYRLHT